MKLKTSPVYIAVFLYRFAFLLLALPLQAVLFEGISPDKAIYIYRLDIFVLLFLCLWSVLCFLSIKLRTNKKALSSQKGILIARKNQIFTNTFDSLQISENLIFSLFKVSKVQTTASKSNNILYLNRKDSKYLAEFFCTDKAKSSEKLHSNLFSVLIFSASFSGALTGLLSAIPLLRNIAGVIGENYTRDFLLSADLWVYIGYTALPPFLRTLSTLFLWAWTVGTLTEANRYMNLCTYIQGGCIHTHHGLLTKHASVLNKASVSALVLRQSILLRLLRLHTAEAYVPAQKKEIKVHLLLACRKSHCKALLFLFNLPQNENCSEHTKPPANSLWGYVWKPMLFLSLNSLVCIVVDTLTVYNVEIHLMLFITLWSCVWFLFSAFSHRHSALFCTSGGLVIRTAKNLSFTEVYIPADKIRAIKTTQNIFQKRKGLCNLYVYIRSSHRQCFLIKHIDKNKTAQFT